MSGALKKTTGLTGLKVCEHPARTLSILYGKILRVLQKFPANYPYKDNTEQLIKSRAQILNSTNNVNQIEEKIGCGQVEELIVQANSELKLANNMLEWKPWEPVMKAPKNQWTWPPHV